MRKVVLSCAVTGDGPLHPRYPDYPTTPVQIANACIEAADAGASIVHIHARESDTGMGSRDPAKFEEIVGRIRDHNKSIIINLSAGMGASFIPEPDNESVAHPSSDVATAHERLIHVRLCEPDICTLDVTTMNMDGGIANAPSCVYMNTPHTLRRMAAEIMQLGVKPEIEAFNPGDILFAERLIEEGLIEGPPMIQLCLGVKWSAPADPATLTYMAGLIPAGANWAAFGVSKYQMPILAQTVILGGNVRVGLEDNIYLSRGVFATNTQLIERARMIIEALGEAIAVPQEAAEILSLTNYDKTRR